MSDMPDDIQILEAARQHHFGKGVPTYYIRNVLGRNEVKTSWILAQMKRLELLGVVSRSKRQDRANMILWDVETPSG